MTVRILNAHVLAALAELPDESVHVVCTSPPYHGLRDYKTAAQVWGDSECEHEWGGVLQHIGGGGGQGSTSQRIGRSNVEDQKKQRDAGAFCRRCGAWRGSLGLEPDVFLYLEHLVLIFREIRRVLRRDGTAWVNLSSNYAGSWGAQSRRETPPTLSRNQIVNHPKKAHNTGSICRPDRPPPCDCGSCGLCLIHAMGRILRHKPKDRVDVPAMFALAMVADGWWDRSDICWAKKSPMPESTTDRPTSAWEHIYLFAKSGDTTFWTHRDHAGSRTRPAPDYRWQRLRASREVEYETAEEPAGWRDDPLWRRINLWDAHDYYYDAGSVKEAAESDHPSGNSFVGRQGTASHQVRGGGFGGPEWTGVGGTRNLRNWWLLGPAPFSDQWYDFVNADYVDDRGVPRKLSPNCPVHGQGGLHRPETPGAVADDVRQAVQPSRTPRTDDCHVQEPAAGFVAIERCKPLRPEDNQSVSRQRSTRASRTDGDRLADSPQRLSHTQDIPASLVVSKTDYSDRACAQTATDHSTQKNKTDPVPVISRRDTLFVESVDDTRHTQPLLFASLPDHHTRESNIAVAQHAQLGQLSDTRGKAYRNDCSQIHIPSHNAKCACAISQSSHFATFSPEIPRRAILAGTSERGCCPKCGAGWARVIETSQQATQATNNAGKASPDNGWAGKTDQYPRTRRIDDTLGWQPTCSCNAGDPVPCTVLDPFAGAFTTSLVAEQLQRDSIAIELSPAYVAMGRKRLRDEAPLLYREAAE